jgi:hypothetical protein
MQSEAEIKDQLTRCSSDIVSSLDDVIENVFLNLVGDLETIALDQVLEILLSKYGDYLTVILDQIEALLDTVFGQLNIQGLLDTIITFMEELLNFSSFLVDIYSDGLSITDLIEIIEFLVGDINEDCKKVAIFLYNNKDVFKDEYESDGVTLIDKEPDRINVFTKLIGEFNNEVSEEQVLKLASLNTTTLEEEIIDTLMSVLKTEICLNIEVGDIIGMILIATLLSLLLYDKPSFADWLERYLLKFLTISCEKIKVVLNPETVFSPSNPITKYYDGMMSNLQGVIEEEIRTMMGIDIYAVEQVKLNISGRIDSIGERLKTPADSFKKIEGLGSLLEENADFLVGEFGSAGVKDVFDIDIVEDKDEKVT